MPENKNELDARNRFLVEELRNAFIPALSELTHRSEPAVIYFVQKPTHAVDTFAGGEHEVE